MYKDVIGYQLADGMSKTTLIDIAGRIIREWMSRQKGFIKWEIHQNGEGGYTDIVYWESREDALAAEKEMVNIPDAAEWYGCYKEGSVSANHLSVVASF
ncbi:MAG: hypothetical protein D6677_07880 [Calditrichaeota bacterium]|nr:MAG: hypothetical protein D6677_07880 [Calditrichota bacterium]